MAHRKGFVAWLRTVEVEMKTEKKEDSKQKQVSKEGKQVSDKVKTEVKLPTRWVDETSKGVGWSLADAAILRGIRVLRQQVREKERNLDTKRRKFRNELAREEEAIVALRRGLHHDEEVFISDQSSAGCLQIAI